jgi:hypothetical protein
VSDEDEVVRYAAGCACVGSRTISARQVVWVERTLRSNRRALGIAAGTVVVSLAIAVFTPWPEGAVGVALLHGIIGTIACIVRERGAPRWVAIAVALAALAAGILQTTAVVAAPELSAITVALLAALVAVGLGFAVSWSAQRVRLARRAAVVREDLREGSLLCFAHPSGRSRRALEVLPRSGLAVTVAGAPVPLVPIVVEEVARARPHALTAALPRELVPRGGDPTVQVRRRSLSAAERIELSRHVRRLRQRWWPAVAATVATLVIGGLALDRGGGLAVGAIGWGLLAAAAWTVQVRRWVAAHRMARDHDLRWVVTVRAREDAPPRLEILPHSRLVWTEGTEPAHWRFEAI